MAINLHLLSVFDSVARAGNVTRAAESLAISQPAVSKHLKTLERQLGVQLFERARRGVRLTREGEELSNSTKRIFAIVAEVEAKLANLQGLRAGELSIGAGTTVGTYLLPEAIVRFRHRFPGIKLHLETALSQMLQQRLREGAIEFAITEVPLRSPEFENVVLMTDDLVGIVAPDHPLAAAKSVSAARFATEPFVVREASSGTQSLVERVFRERRLTIKPVLSLSSTEAVKRAVAVGLGVSIVSKMSLGSELEAKHLVALKLKDVPLRRPVYLIRLRTRVESRAATAFLCLLKHVIRGTLPKIGERRTLSGNQVVARRAPPRRSATGN